MNIKQFISKFKNHPILFVGTGMSLRYLENSYSWNGLLERISYDISGNDEHYLDLKSQNYINGQYDYSKIAGILEKEFNAFLQENRDGKFKDINDVFYANMRNNKNISKFKIYISRLLSDITYKNDIQNELDILKKVRKNIGSIITTNYDTMIENIFEFNPLIGNNILLSNPYGAVYKIHGCINAPDKIIITEKDYSEFDEKYELIRAQLLSLFIHNPIIFIGYNIGDENIKKILKTIFTYVEPNSEQSEKIRSNFLLVEYEKDSDNLEVTEHDIDLEGFSTIRINKIKTDNYIEIYNSLSDLQLSISAMDIRKVQSIVKEIYTGGNGIKVNITEDLDSLGNSDKVLVIGSEKTITYVYQNTAQVIANYFNIIEESNIQLLNIVDKLRIQESQYFPIFAFSQINNNINSAEKLKKQQQDKLESIMSNIPPQCKQHHNSIANILDDNSISQTYKSVAIIYSIMNNNLRYDDIEQYLKQIKTKDTNYKKLLCAYDYIKYNN